MGTCGRRVLGVWFFFWFLLTLEQCTSLNREGAALLRFKAAIEADPYGALLDWNQESLSPCTWFGVECSDDGLVMSLSLANLGLKGVLSPELGKLMQMKSLILHNNSFYGTIPREIGDLQDLKMLDLGYNNFSGSIPSELQHILSLEFLCRFLEGITLFRRSELETACEGFSNIIDTLPGFTLFKGTLPCGAEIAVASTSVAYAGGWSAIDEAHYMNKVGALSKVNHKNLLNLVGYCEDEKPFIRMMVFEYASNGSLFERLHVKEAEHLNWQSRLRIAMGVLYCLQYMHQQNTPVTLKNLNSSYIYLTEDDAAKVSDISFSVDKREDDEYDAPDEYSTVYKFALLLLETISGRRPYSEDDGLLVLWARRYLTCASPVMGMIDPTLNSVPEEHARALSELIRLCLSEDRRQRPTMAEVTKRMQEITGITQDQAIPRNSALWWAELEIMTS
ncbi:protein MALE DISCOVERER 2 isoform X3 [Zea mays]|uniref:Putative leucine-rich repeat transmembrane protein kinase family protein n=1 Tax=Zea mays TaxID=4577 RepID=A0A1D6M6B0_MAIZE|nr:protein MALE DISCOVERER 2 isoform X3 [Zea mays]AQK86615.1 Putative leucine-rich repeat transmembrane protein kinase family protein [Zea mays]|eukprot:XP_008649737.1 protein MALE DISCOVERER 2 isoform X3 [Zea mays]